jgi:hypothetical protein
MSLYKQFQTNESLEKEGVILNYGKNSKGVNIDIRIARAGGHNLKFAKVAEQVLKPYRRQIANETADREVTKKVNHLPLPKQTLLNCLQTCPTCLLIFVSRQISKLFSVKKN